MRIVQIVPAGDPGGGVAGYAEALARGLAERCGIESDLLASGASLDVRALTGTACLLHYVNYAYHPRGCPAGLVEDLRRWRLGSPGRRLVTFFHEVYATGPVWRSSFWLAPRQRRLARTLARTSDRIATSLPLYGRMLKRLAPGATPAVAPVFSTVGEPAAVPPLSGRPPRLLVFGGGGVRARAWGEALPALAAACRSLGAREVADVGPALPGPALPGEIAGVPVRSLGLLPEAAVAEQLRSARFGFLAYPPDFLPKSTIFAAYAAHGLLPACAGELRPEQAGDPRPPFWAPGSPPPSPEEGEALARAARAWYLEHSLARQAESFRDLLLAAGALR